MEPEELVAHVVAFHFRFRVIMTFDEQNVCKVDQRVFQRYLAAKLSRLDEQRLDVILG